MRERAAQFRRCPALPVIRAASCGGAGGVAVAVRLDLLRPARCGADHLREHREVAAGDVDVLLKLAQDRGEFAGIDVVGGQVVLDLLEGELGDAERGATPFQAGTGTAGHRVVALAVATKAATVSQPWCRAEARGKAFSLNHAVRAVTDFGCRGDGGGRSREKPVLARSPLRRSRPTRASGRPSLCASGSRSRSTSPRRPPGGPSQAPCRGSDSRGSQASMRTQVRPARRNRVPSRPWPQCMTTRPGTRTRSWPMETHTSPTSSARVTVVLRW